MATYEGKWRCARCSTANLGRHLNCQTCGVKRSEDVQFFLEDNAPAVTDRALLQQANAGADWICQYCGGNNRFSEGQCSSCGNTRGAGDRRLEEETRGVNDWSEAAQKALANNRPQADVNLAVATNPKSTRRFLKYGLLGLGLLAPIFIVFLGVLIYISTLTYPVEITVVGLEWERRIAVEEYRTVTEKGWEGEVPATARVQSSTRAVHHIDKVPSGSRSVPEIYTEQVAAGTERYVCGRKNKKNGYFEDEYCTRTKYKTVTKTRTRTETVYKDVPVYRTQYTYLIDKWVSAGERITSGRDFNPQWAMVTTDAAHRENGRKEIYVLITQELENRKEHRFDLTADNWQRFQNGMRLHGKLDVLGSLVSIEELPNGKW